MYKNEFFKCILPVLVMFSSFGFSGHSLSALSLYEVETVFEKMIPEYVPKHREYKIRKLSEDISNLANRLMYMGPVKIEYAPINDTLVFSDILYALRSGKIEFDQDLNIRDICNDDLNCKIPTSSGYVFAKFKISTYFDKIDIFFYENGNTNLGYNISVYKHGVSFGNIYKFKYFGIDTKRVHKANFEGKNLSEIVANFINDLLGYVYIRFDNKNTFSDNLNTIFSDVLDYVRSGKIKFDQDLSNKSISEIYDKDVDFIMSDPKGDWRATLWIGSNNLINIFFMDKEFFRGREGGIDVYRNICVSGDTISLETLYKS